MVGTFHQGRHVLGWWLVEIEGLITDEFAASGGMTTVTLPCVCRSYFVAYWLFLFVQGGSLADPRKGWRRRAAANG